MVALIWWSHWRRLVSFKILHACLHGFRKTRREPLMRLLICAGGTGGGVYPALAVLQALESENERKTARSFDGMEEDQDQQGRISGVELLWVGGLGGMESELVQQRGVTYAGIPAAGIHGVGLRALPGNLWEVGRGVISA